VSTRQQEQAQREREGESVLKLTEFVTASELAVMMDVTSKSGNRNLYEHWVDGFNQISVWMPKPLIL